MASQNRSEPIKSNPIGNGLDGFLLSFRSICGSKDLPCSGEALNQLNDEDLRNVAIDLFVALNALQLPRLLPFGGTNLFNHILRLTLAISSSDFDLTRTKPLLRAVVAKKPDEEIWAQVYRAVTESTPPPRSIASHLQQTPSSRNMGSLVNSSEYRKNTDGVLKEDLGPLYVDIPQFHETFFSSVPDLERISKIVFQKCCEGSNPMFREGWTGWPKDAQEPAVLSWLQGLIEQLIRWARDQRPIPASAPTRGLVAEPNKPLVGSTAKRKLDVGFVSHPAALKHWSQILIPGELKSNPEQDSHSKAWQDIGRYTREVFAAQDTRRFVLAFTLCGSLMRVWEFDRLGGIASARFDINEDGQQFILTILGFLWMKEQDMGFDATIMTPNNDSCIEIIRNRTRERIIIDEVVTRAPYITGRGTTCWRAHLERDRSATLVIKDSWQHPEWHDEGKLLSEVTEKGVRNVARYYHHETVRLPDGSIDDVQGGVRKGLDITKASNYGLHPDLAQSAGKKRSSSETGAALPSSKRSCSHLVKTDCATQGLNRIHRRIIIRDFGRPIYKAGSRVALLAALEGCIEGHQSLLCEGDVLHRDISINNLMMNDEASANPSWPSFLIDLDLAIPTDRKTASGAKGRIGTRAFMAIGVLMGEQHSFVHDLESFFWVLLWICIHYDGPGKKSRVVDEFDQWNYANMDLLATWKSGIVSKDAFFIQKMTRCFTPYYEPLLPWVNRLRRVVFDNNWQEGDETLYTRMRDVLCKAQRDPNI
ncbi:hypothetical protein GGS23DRAFT_608368 [Durotheca rogersii]|uniref:uncharacterized protein n=1 Tax=Durotheca rogersii TaxID=419775 RepID=UPI00221EABBD|nr:uncharacterized protein GGS23DRAFT_608368 [Durotheca rogersii]KAI5853656.1 hypothetical protein GGS23DRAFT_608368 [Durotheca rogersii]